MAHSIHFGLIGPVRSYLVLFALNSFYSVHSVHFDPLLSYSVHSVYFGLIRSYPVHIDPIQSTSIQLCPLCLNSVHFGPIRSTSVLFSPSCPLGLIRSYSVYPDYFGLSWSYSIHFAPIQSIFSTSIQSVLFGPLSSNLVLFNQLQSYLVLFCPLQSIHCIQSIFVHLYNMKK